MKAEIGDEVGLYYDADDQVAVGDFLQTRTKRCYRVVKVRQQMRGFNAGRFHLRCEVVAEPKVGSRVFSLIWYPR